MIYGFFIPSCNYILDNHPSLDECIEIINKVEKKISAGHLPQFVRQFNAIRRRAYGILINKYHCYEYAMA